MGVQAHHGTVEEELDLLNPLQLGPFKLAHRIALAPLTRNLPGSTAVIYYSQRATPGGLLISEAFAVSLSGLCGGPRWRINSDSMAPGIWTQEQIEAWKPITKAVHAKGAIFFCQLWHGGRISGLIPPNGAKPVSSTSRATTNGDEPFAEPHALEIDEITEVVNEFVVAAKNAIAAGEDKERFDGVELHAAHGYLIEQFLKDGINDRTDKYGGSIENRARFLLEIVDALGDAIGADRVGVRLSPFASLIGEATDSDPEALGVYLAQKLNEKKIAYIHVVEPRMDVLVEQESEHNLWPFKKAFKGIFLGAGGYTRESGIQAIKEGRIDVAVYGRHFIANPDLVRRFKFNAPLNKYNRDTFYSPDPVVGYTDYPFLEESHPEFSEPHLLIRGLEELNLRLSN